MKPLSLLLRPIGRSNKTAVILGSVFMLIFFAASVYMPVFFELMLPAVIAALLALCVVFFRMKVHLLVLKLPLIYHLISVLACLYMAVRFYDYTDGSKLYMLVSSASSGAVVFSLAEILCAVVLSFVSDGAHPKNIFKALAAAAPLLFTTIVYVPCDTYFSNRKDFLFVFFDFAPYLFIKFAVICLISAVAACAIKEKIFRILSGLAVGLTLCVYCQYMFLNSSLPSTFGDPVDWDSMTTLKTVNLVIWVILLILPVVFVVLSGKIKAVSGKASARNAHLLLNTFIGGMQLLSLLILISTSQTSLFKHERYVLDNSEQFVVSGKKNIITIILDHADRHYFEDAYQLAPEKFDCLKDFTYYNNACMMYDSTYLSIPEMLSGTTELPEHDLESWLYKTWSSDPCEAFYSRLHEENYTVNAYGTFSYIFDPYLGKFDNCTYAREEDFSLAKDFLYHNINVLAEYRYMPWIMKKSIADSYINTVEGSFLNSCIYKNEEFISKLDLKLSDTDKNYFIVEHLMGTHWHTKQPLPDRTFTCLELLDKYLGQLKKLGVYDDAVIIITSDHGEHSQPDNVPIWYIKTAGAHNDKMQYCSAPIHHSDYLATCLDSAGLKKESDGELFGRSIFDIPEDEQRQRLVFQRFGFKYTGDIDFKICTSANHTGAAYGYYFTGTREDLARRENEGPPDILIELNDHY